MNELKELSYAWALAPLLVLTVVAYVRRWRHSKSTEKNRDTRAAVDTLSDMLNDGSKRLFDANIANDDEHFRWNLDLASWQRQVEDHLESFFSRAEKNGFANLVLVNDQQIVGSYNPTHNWQRCRLANQLTKIRAIMIRYSAVGQ